MTDAEYADVVIADGIKDQIRVLANLPDTDSRIIGFTRYEGKIAEQFGIDLDLPLDALRRERIILGNVAINVVEISLCRDRVANSHTPCRLKKAAISSLLTNSPRSAASSPFLTAALSSSVKW